MKEEAVIIRSIIDKIKSKPQDSKASLEELGNVAARLEAGKLGIVFNTKPRPIKGVPDKPTHVTPIHKHVKNVLIALYKHDYVAYYHVPVHGLIAVPGDGSHKVPEYRCEGPFQILQYQNNKLIAHDDNKKNILCEGEDNSFKMLAENIIPELITREQREINT